MQNESEDQQQQKRNHPIILAILSLVCAICERSCHGNTTDEMASDPEHQIAKWTKVVGNWTRGLVFVGVLTAAVLALQLCVLKQTDETARTTNRAWLAPSQARKNPDFPFEAGKTFHYIIDFRNTGREPAKDVAIYEDPAGPRLINSRKEENNWGDVFNGIDNHSCDGKIPGKNALVVYPSDKDRPYFVDSSFSIPKEVEDRSKVLFVQGCMAYTTFDKIRYDGFCFFLLPTDEKPFDQWTFAHCPVGNYSKDKD